MDYRSTLTLHDRRGGYATFARRQHVRLLHDGVSAILDHAWGDGVLVTNYETDAGQLEETLYDGETRHLVIGLKRVMARGESFTFHIERTAIVGFTAEEEWLETLLDHPVRRLRPQVVFPKSRPCQGATLSYGGASVPLAVQECADGRTRVAVTIPHPQAHVSYTIRWRW